MQTFNHPPKGRHSGPVSIVLQVSAASRAWHPSAVLGVVPELHASLIFFWHHQLTELAWLRPCSWLFPGPSSLGLSKTRAQTWSADMTRALHSLILTVCTHGACIPLWVPGSRERPLPKILEVAKQLAWFPKLPNNSCWALQLGSICLRTIAGTLTTPQIISKQSSCSLV